MKRKRAHRADAHASKRTKLHHSARPADALLQQYYASVVTLRQYCASRLPKRRAKKLRQYDGEAVVVELLDTTRVGAPQRVHIDTSSFEDEDLSVFTQQLTHSDSSIALTPGALKQPEILDFTVWLLFRRHSGNTRPKHLLCHNFQKYLSEWNGDHEPQIVPGIPGIYSCGRNEYVDLLRAHPWSELPHLLGKGAERILVDLLVECGTFVPVSGSGNLRQISGLPMCDLGILKPAIHSADREAERDVTPARLGTRSTTNKRGLSDIRFARHRMLYGRAALNARGSARFGLGHMHVLNRMRNLHDLAETTHVMKYIFPKQFGLHNVLNSPMDRKVTAQPFQDYTLREQEIKRKDLNGASKNRVTGNESDAKHQSLPKRLRGTTLHLVGRIRKRHSTCAYAALLNHYCPKAVYASHERDDSVLQATSIPQVSAFCRAAVANVFPRSLWGNNVHTLDRSIDKFVRLRRYETLSLHDVMQAIKLDDIVWLMPSTVPKGASLSRTDFEKRKELMSELLYYVFDSYLIPLIRGHFHVTESNVHRNLIFYFRHDVWKEMSEPALCSLKHNMMEECSPAAAKTILSKRSLGVSHVRLLPKTQGMRPIINLRRRAQKLQSGRLVLGRSINSLLTPAFSVLKYERTANPTRLGSALFSVEDIFPRLQQYRRLLSQKGMLGKRLYFAKVDVQACFDTIPQEHLLQLVGRILRADRYRITKYSRGKLTGGHNHDLPEFAAKPSWKFLTKASVGVDEFNLREEIEKDTIDGRTRSVYVSGLAQRPESRKAILDLLNEHVGMNLIKIGKRFYRQKEGIPQGSIMSSLLCSYFYAELENEALDFIDPGNSVLLRLIDDFLVISTEKDVATKFMQVMHAGLPQFGVKVKMGKSQANFDMQIDGKAVAKVSESEAFPYCGNAIHPSTLDLSKDRERRRKSNLADTVTVEYSKIPGQSFYRKTLNALKLQMHAMLLSTAYNSVETVLSNLHHAFSEVAQKSYHYIKSLLPAKRPSNNLVIRALDNTIKLACVLMKRRMRTSKDVFEYECCITNTQARWLAYSAFTTVFSRRQTKFGGLLEFVERGLLGLRVGGVERRMLEKAAGVSTKARSCVLLES